MQLTPYVENLRRELAAAAEAGGDEALALAERLSVALDSAAHLTLLEALSAAADEITRDLAPGSVEVRLRGRDPEFVVTPSPAEASNGDADAAGPEEPRPVPPDPDAEDGATSRITLRLPEHLKPKIEAAAGKEGLSVNAWLVRAVSAALTVNGRSDQARRQYTGKHYTGWVR